MSARGDGPGDLPDGVPAISEHEQDTARELALGDECRRADRQFEQIVRSAEAELLRSAWAYASKLVGANEADDVLNIVREKVWLSFDPGRGTFKSFFFTTLHNTCLDLLRKRRARPQPAACALADWAPGSGLHAPDPADEVIARIDALQGRIAAAIEVLDLPERRRDMLRALLDFEEAALPADPRAAAVVRQQRSRGRRVLDEVAGLTEGELAAVSLMRKHHTVAADMQGQYASAKRKVLALLGIETED
ncbi:MAG TPA: sigma factor [Streptosporangiaceae bacterium]|nr:sigma factor [Streptosporangiaceae bacterium]